MELGEIERRRDEDRRANGQHGAGLAICDHAPTLAQNDPKIEPNTITAESAINAPTMATTKISL